MSDDLHDHRIKYLIKELVARSDDKDESKRLKWEAVDTDLTDGYELSLTRSSLRITAEDEDGDWYPYVFSLLGESGNLVEDVYASSDRNDEFGLHELFKAASRNHRGVSEKLTEVFEELGIPDPPPPSAYPSGSTPPANSDSKSEDEPAA
ncbi:hypothetical protein ACQI5H_24260 [Mycobacterium heidelbergense]|uniref:hypothetical protein n=1 Tax=Mycobacterium heidelbergense TaxID=53376 RepID=UPI003CF4AE74